MCAALFLYVLTIPPNIKYVSEQLAEHSLFLHAPKLPYDPAWFQNCLYFNPHISHPSVYENYSARKKASGTAPAPAGMSEQQLAAQRALKLQQTQVDEVFESLKGGDDLDETDPGACPSLLGRGLGPTRVPAPALAPSASHRSFDADLALALPLPFPPASL